MERPVAIYINDNFEAFSYESNAKTNASFISLYVIGWLQPTPSGRCLMKKAGDKAAYVTLPLSWIEALSVSSYSNTVCIANIRLEDAHIYWSYTCLDRSVGELIMAPTQCFGTITSRESQHCRFNRCLQVPIFEFSTGYQLRQDALVGVRKSCRDSHKAC